MAKLTAARRQAMPKKDFALPGKGEGPKGAGSGSYPIEDRAHARAALSRVSANGSPAEKAEVRAKVDAKYPQMATKDAGKTRMAADSSAGMAKKVAAALGKKDK